MADEERPLAKLNGAQRREFVAALVDAFPSYANLERMVSFGLDETLARIVGGGGLEDVAFSLVRWAESRGRLGQLVQAAREANPDNPTLAAFVTGTWAAFAPAAVPDTPVRVPAEPRSQLLAPGTGGADFQEPAPDGGAAPHAAAAQTEALRFFVSYNRADRRWAEWIAWQLETVGHEAVLQAWDFRPGSNFVEQMQDATAKADRTIAVLSPDYLASNFTAPEWQAAFRQDPKGEEGLLVPVRVREVERSGLLGSIVYVDLVGLDEAAARAELLAGVVPGRAKPDVPPSFPNSAGSGVAPAPGFPGRAAAQQGGDDGSR